MKFEKKYCKRCKGIYQHIVEKDFKGVERLFWAVTTIGASEMFNSKYYTCTNCECKTED